MEVFNISFVKIVNLFNVCITVITSVVFVFEFIQMLQGGGWDIQLLHDMCIIILKIFELSNKVDYNIPFFI